MAYTGSIMSMPESSFKALFAYTGSASDGTYTSILGRTRSNTHAHTKASNSTTSATPSNIQAPLSVRNVPKFRDLRKSIVAKEELRRTAPTMMPTLVESDDSNIHDNDKSEYTIKYALKTYLNIQLDDVYRLRDEIQPSVSLLQKHIRFERAYMDYCQGSKFTPATSSPHTLIHSYTHTLIHS